MDDEEVIGKKASADVADVGQRDASSHFARSGIDVVNAAIFSGVRIKNDYFASCQALALTLTLTCDQKPSFLSSAFLVDFYYCVRE